MVVVVVDPVYTSIRFDTGILIKLDSSVYVLSLDSVSQISDVSSLYLPAVTTKSLDKSIVSVEPPATGRLNCFVSLL